MSSVLFGELVEPTTRALIDEDLEEYPEYVEIAPLWEGKTEIPEEIRTLYIVETKIIKDLLIDCVLIGNNKPICSLINGGIDIYNLEGKKYVVVYQNEKELNHCQIVELIENWIIRAEKIFILTSESIYSYQNCFLPERPPYIIKILSNCDDSLGFSRLEQPNLVTGLGAAVLSYCLHQSLRKCTLIVVYLQQTQQYSLNGGKVLELFRKVDLDVKNVVVRDRNDVSNLYM